MFPPNLQLSTTLSIPSQPRSSHVNINSTLMTIGKIPDLHTPFRDCWSTARTLWKCHLWTRNSILDPLETNSVVRSCCLQSLESLVVNDNRMFHASNYISIMFLFYFSFLTIYSWLNIPLHKFDRRQKMQLVW
jgi:hypothetical protein